MADLVISINGDVKNYEDALEKAQEKTEALNGRLESLSKVAAVAFAALTAEIYESVKAFGESQVASNKLVQALQNQGIYSDELMESYKRQADELQKLTGIDNDAIMKAQALLQGMIGNVEVSEALTKAVLDLSVAKGMDLSSTAELIGKGIEGHTMALQRLGITIDQHLDKEERTAKIIEIVNAKFGDQAAAANQGLGGIKGLHTAFEDLQKTLGEQFAPAIEAVIRGLTNFFQMLNDHKEIVELIGVLIIAGTVVSGLSLAVGLGGMAWLKYTAMMEASAAATEVMSVVTKGLIGATGIGLLVIIISEIYLNWSSIFPKMQQIYEAFVENVMDLSGGLGKILSGVFHLDIEKIKEGMKEAKDAIVAGYQDISESTQSIKVKAPGMEQDEDKAELARIQNDKEIAEEQRKQDVLDAERELELAKIEDQSKAVIDLKTQELETLKAIQEEKNADIRDDLEEHLEEIRDVQEVADQQSESKQAALHQYLLTNSKAYMAMDDAQQKLFIKQNQTQLQNSLETEKTIKNTYALQETQADIQRRNQFLLDEQKFGTAYAAIHQAMHSEIYTGTKAAFSDMAQMTQSHNETLKTMGKVASVANVIIKTAESAMNIYAGFSTIPFIGPALGIAGAAAAIAFGAEQVGTIMSAATGGMVTGGIPGVDSVPAMLMPGELVVPTKNFDEVVGAVADGREDGDDSYEQSGNVGEVVISLKDDLMDFIEMKLVERARFRISIQGA